MDTNSLIWFYVGTDNYFHSTGFHKMLKIQAQFLVYDTIPHQNNANWSQFCILNKHTEVPKDSTRRNRNLKLLFFFSFLSE